MSDPEAPPLPQPSDPVSPASAAPGIKLHSQVGVLIATFLGSPLAGCLVLAQNDFRLRNRRRAWLTIGGGLLGTVLLGTLAALIPDSVKISIAFLVAQLGIMGAVATRLQGETIKQHLQSGGREASKWGAAGIGLAGLILCCTLIFGYIFLTYGPSGTRLQIGASEIYYAGAATKEDALAFTAVLEAEGVLDDTHPITLQLSKDAGANGRFSLCFVVNEPHRSSPDTITGFQHLGHKITNHANLRPLTIWLCDEDMSRRKKIPID